MKKIFKSALAVLVVIIMNSCVHIQQTSMFNSESVREGMTREEIIENFGKPYKEDFKRDSANVLSEQWYYKEVLFRGVAGWYELNSIFHLKDGKLVRYEMGDEHRITDISVIEKEKEEK